MRGTVRGWGQRGPGLGSLQARGCLGYRCRSRMVWKGGGFLWRGLLRTLAGRAGICLRGGLLGASGWMCRRVVWRRRGSRRLGGGELQAGGDGRIMRRRGWIRSGGMILRRSMRGRIRWTIMGRSVRGWRRRWGIWSGARTLRRCTGVRLVSMIGRSGGIRSGDGLVRCSGRSGRGGQANNRRDRRRRSRVRLCGFLLILRGDS